MELYKDSKEKFTLGPSNELMKQIGLRASTSKRKKKFSTYGNILQSLMNIIGYSSSKVVSSFKYFYLSNGRYNKNVLGNDMVNVYTVPVSYTEFGKPIMTVELEHMLYLRRTSTNFIMKKKFISPLKHYVKNYYFV